MKCPKCSYLGFETGDRCKNCSYDFSLIADRSQARETELDLALRASGEVSRVSPDWAHQTDGARVQSPAATDIASLAPLRRESPKVHAEPELPLFALAFDDGGDEPLVKLPATPRPPLAVRRTPETPRLRTVPKPARPVEPVLEFGDEPPATPRLESVEEVRARTAARLAAQLSHREPSGAGIRLVAAAIDHLLLFLIDLAVVYFTLRMTGLSMSDWAALPPMPLFVFLLLVKLSYFCAFTTIGGQTIGKMTAHIRVVTTEDAPVDAALSAKRALAGAISTALLGLGYLPVFLGSERRALHDRVAHTRVIALPSV